MGIRSVLKQVPALFLGVSIITGCGGVTLAGTTHSVEVRITLSDYKIDSPLTTFSKRVTYHLVVTNKGARVHKLRIMPPPTLEEMLTLSEEELGKTTVFMIGDVPPGATETFDLTFQERHSQAELEFACHVPMHYEAGMYLPIQVN